MDIGFCQCGCGQKTKIAKASNKKRGWVKGKPIRFISGHNSVGKRGYLSYSWKGGRTLSSEGYQLTKNPEHPRAYCNGYVPDHISVAQKAFGKPLPLGAVVHHFPDKSSFTNLVICENNSYHKLLHRRYHALKISGHVNWRKCYYCHQYDSPDNLHIADYFPIYHRSCKALYQNNLLHLFA